PERGGELFDRAVQVGGLGQQPAKADPGPALGVQVADRPAQVDRAAAVLETVVIAAHDPADLGQARVRPRLARAVLDLPADRQAPERVAMRPLPLPPLLPPLGP